MKAIIDEYNKVNHFGRFLGMHFNILSPGEVEYHLEITESLLATETAAHGGVLAGFMDAILGVAALSVVAEEGKRVATLELKISFLAPALCNDQLSGKGSVIKKGSRIVFSEGSIYNQNGLLIAKGSGTFTAYPAEQKKEG
ncbi:MAG: PaaI family thioesterase [Flavobacteriales bacterium]|nr:PaaI family thioesterase [Flavobacteriales bacterium]